MEHCIDQGFATFDGGRRHVVKFSSLHRCQYVFLVGVRSLLFSVLEYWHILVLPRAVHQIFVHGRSCLSSLTRIVKLGLRVLPQILVLESLGAKELPVLQFGRIILVHAQRLVPQLVQIDVIRRHIAIDVIERFFSEVSLLLLIRVPKRKVVDSYSRALSLKYPSTFNFHVLVLIVLWLLQLKFVFWDGAHITSHISYLGDPRMLQVQVKRASGVSRLGCIHRGGRSVRLSSKIFPFRRMLVSLVMGLNRQPGVCSIVFVRQITLGDQGPFERAKFLHVARLIASHGSSLGLLMEKLISLVL